MLEESRPRLRKRILDALERADLPSVSIASAVRPDLWNDTEHRIVEWALETAFAHRSAADGSEAEPLPPPVDAADIGIGLREVLLGLTGRFPALTVLGLDRSETTITPSTGDAPGPP